MQSRIGTLVVAVLFLAGVFLGLYFYPRLVGTSAEEWEEQVRLDAISLIDAVHPGMRLPATPELNDAFWEAWDQRREFYEDDRLEQLRDKLLLYLQFVEVEWDEAHAIWTAGDHTILSEEAKRLHARMKEEFGPDGERIVALFAEKVREDAYQASPKIAGYDENRPYDQWHVAVKGWLPEARARAAELTQPLD